MLLLPESWKEFMNSANGGMTKVRGVKTVEGVGEAILAYDVHGCASESVCQVDRSVFRPCSETLDQFVDLRNVFSNISL